MKGSAKRLKRIVTVLKDNDIISGITPEKAYRTIVDLGPTFIKLGQILSTRVDLIGEAYAKELSKLRSDVNPISFNEIEDILNKNYKNYKEIFVEIDKKPIGSASIAQVHRAKLENGNNVVLKIKRPNIDEQFRRDIELLKKAIDILHINKIIRVINLDQVLDEVYSTTLEELNFKMEVNHLLKFPENNKNFKFVSSPQVYPKYSTNNVIVMEYIEGIKISDVEKLNEKYNLKELAKIISKNYIKQALDDGLFHADPHPDNILVNDKSIYFIDLGMMGTLTEKNKTSLDACVDAIVNKEYRKVAEILVNMSETNGDIDYELLTNDIKNILEQYSELDISKISTKDFITEMFKMLNKHKIILDRNIVMLIRGIGIIEGVLETLDPNTSLFKVLNASEEEKIVTSMLDIDKVKQVGKKVIQNTNNMIEIPTEVLNFFKSFNNGETKFKFELNGTEKHIDKIESLVHEAILGFIDGCAIIAYASVTDSKVKLILLGTIIILSIWIIIKMIIDTMRKGY